MIHLWVIFESFLIFNRNKSDQNGAEIAYSPKRFTFGWECKNEFWNHFDFFFFFFIQIHFSSGQITLPYWTKITSNVLMIWKWLHMTSKWPLMWTNLHNVTKTGPTGRFAPDFCHIRELIMTKLCKISSIWVQSGRS